MNAQELFESIFAEPRTDRSPEYQAGVLAALQFRLGEAESIATPHEPGTTAADAYFAGIREGHFHARQHLAEDCAAAEDDHPAHEPDEFIGEILGNIEGHLETLAGRQDQLATALVALAEALAPADQQGTSEPGVVRVKTRPGKSRTAASPVIS